jgi:hypothetical protein
MEFLVIDPGGYGIPAFGHLNRLYRYDQGQEEDQQDEQVSFFHGILLMHRGIHGGPLSQASGFHS